MTKKIKLITNNNIPAVAATNNLMTALCFSSEMSGLWPGLGPQKIRWKTGRRT